MNKASCPPHNALTKKRPPRKCGTNVKNSQQNLLFRRGGRTEQVLYKFLFIRRNFPRILRG